MRRRRHLLPGFRFVLAATLLACAPAEEPPEEPAPSAPPPSEPASGTNGALPPDAESTVAADPPAGLEPARPAPDRPAAGTSARDTGAASAYWGRHGPDLDAASPWRSLSRDGIHDPGTDAVALLQQPRSAFRSLPRANSGNLVDWAAAIKTEAIRPRARVGSAGTMERYARDILRVDTGTMPHVVFPHEAHTEWLSCGNCHDRLFRKQAGATDITMRDIAEGRSCGLCHGKVAFPPTECFRCHSGPRPR